MTIDVLLLVRGGGSAEDLAAFNDEALARAIAACPVPVITGIGHQTDFSIADFVADLRAPTPTAAGELAAMQHAVLEQELDRLAGAIDRNLRLRLDRSNQALDLLASGLSRPTLRLAQESMRLGDFGRQHLRALQLAIEKRQAPLRALADRFPASAREKLNQIAGRLDSAAIRLEASDPAQVLRRGFVWVARTDGRPVCQLAELALGNELTLQFVDGQATAIVSGVGRQP